MHRRGSGEFHCQHHPWTIELCLVWHRWHPAFCAQYTMRRDGRPPPKIPRNFVWGNIRRHFRWQFRVHNIPYVTIYRPTAGQFSEICFNATCAANQSACCIRPISTKRLAAVKERAVHPLQTFIRFSPFTSLCLLPITTPETSPRPFVPRPHVTSFAISVGYPNFSPVRRRSAGSDALCLIPTTPIVPH